MLYLEWQWKKRQAGYVNHDDKVAAAETEKEKWMRSIREYGGQGGEGDDIYAMTQYVQTPVHMDTMITSLHGCCQFGIIMVCCSA